MPEQVQGVLSVCACENVGVRDCVYVCVHGAWWACVCVCVV